MIELLILALIGSGIAGIWDLKTTEVPDQIPYLMSGSGLLYWAAISFLENSIDPFGLSLLSGLIILIPGLLLYKAGKWGAADAWIPASIMFMIPVFNNEIIIFSYLANFLLVSTGFMFLYSAILGIKNKKVFPLLLKDLKTNKWPVRLIMLYLLINVPFIYFFSLRLIPFLYSFLIISFMIVFWRYAIIIENHVFRRSVKTKDLKEGDVLNSMIWIGLTKKEIQKLKKQKKTVIVKEGVRFVPVYPLTLLVTVLYGNLLFYLL